MTIIHFCLKYVVGDLPYFTVHSCIVKLRLSGGLPKRLELTKVDNFCYLGSMIKSTTSDFEHVL